MTTQDNETYRERASKAVIDALLEAGRRHPGSPDINLDLDAAMEAMSHAVVVLALTSAQIVEDRDKAAAMILGFRKRISRQLTLAAKRVKAGELTPTATERPKLRIVT